MNKMISFLSVEANVLHYLCLLNSECSSLTIYQKLCVALNKTRGGVSNDLHKTNDLITGSVVL